MRLIILQDEDFYLPKPIKELTLRSFCHVGAPQAGIQMPLRLLDASTEYAAVSLKSTSCARLDSRLRGNDPRRSGRKSQSLPRRRLG